LGTARVAFVAVPRLVRDLIVALLPPDAAVVIDKGETDVGDVLAAVASGRVDVLVAGPRFLQPHEICRLLESWPRLKTLVLLDEGRRVAFYEVRARRETGELTADTLAAVVAAVQRRCVDDLGEASR
jgi:hypothetical protein